MVKKKVEVKEKEQSEMLPYEIGYLLAPTIPEEHIGEEASRVREMVEKHGGEPFADNIPVSKQLGYQLAPTRGSGKQRYDKGYFGWIKFELAPPEVKKLSNTLDANDKILRYLLTRTERFETPEKMPRSPLIKTPRPAKEVAQTPDSSPIISDEELDKRIEELVID
jgi:ribosomal protein S6